MKRLTVRQKLTFAVAWLVFSLLGLSFTAWNAIGTLSNSLDAAVNTTAKKLDLIGATQAAFQDLKQESAREQLAHAIVGMERRPASKGHAPSAEGVSCSACHAPLSLDESTRNLEARAAVVTQKTGELRRLVADRTAIGALDAIDKGKSGWVEHDKQYLALASANRFEDAHDFEGYDAADS